MTTKALELGAEEHRVLNYMASMPALAHIVVDRKVAKAILIGTDAQLFANGILWRIKSKSLGAGTYELTLERWNKSE